MNHSGYLASLLVVLSTVSAALAADEPPPELRSLSDAEIRTRLADAEQLLDDGETYAEVWWYGWTGFYAIGVVYQGVEAATNHHDSKGRKVEKIVGSVKATIGVVGQFARPLDARAGADPVRALPSATREDRLRQLLEAEHRLERIAKQSDGRFSLLRHGMNVGINLAGGLIVSYGFDEETRGWRSAAIGTAVGEVMIWSMPWWGRDHLEEYQARHKVRLPYSPEVSWNVAPTIGGAALQVRF